MEGPVNKDTFIDVKPYLGVVNRRESEGIAQDKNMIDYIIDALKDLNVHKGKIGMELQPIHQLTMSYTDITRLFKTASDAEFVDASEISLKCRTIKSELEVEALRRSCEITSIAWDKFFENITKGTNEEEIVQMVFNYMMDEGTHRPAYAWPHIWPDEEYMSMPDPNRKLEDGDVFWMDLGAFYKEYMSDISRMGVVGGPNENHKKMFDKLLHRFSS